MYLDITPEQRAQFFAQFSGNHIPGYTGHCPTLKFRFGQCYGANTKQIMQELSDAKIIKNVKREPYQRGENYRPQLNPPIPNSQGQIRDVGSKEIAQHRSRRYILGYTGYIPGLSFRYGKSYVRAADDCMAEFGARLLEQRKRFETERRARSAPQMVPIRGRDEVSKTMTDYTSKKTSRFKEVSDHHLSPNSPPIAGYTGHIPRMANCETSLSQRFECAARKSLAQLDQERRQRKHVKSAERKIANNINELSHNKKN